MSREMPILNTLGTKATIKAIITIRNSGSLSSQDFHMIGKGSLPTACACVGTNFKFSYVAGDMAIWPANAN